MSFPVKAPAPEKTVVRFEIAPSTIGLILATGAGVWLLRELWVIGLLVVVALVLVGGLYYYRRMEKTFADVV